MTSLDHTSIAVGTKLRFKNGQELVHVLSLKNGKFEARVNGSKFNITGEVSNLIDSESFVKITDDEYNTELDAFWASGRPQGERVE